MFYFWSFLFFCLQITSEEQKYASAKIWANLLLFVKLAQIQSSHAIYSAMDMTFRFPCTLGSFQSYTVNNMNKYFSFCGDYLPHYSFICRMLLFIFPCNSCFSLIDKTFKKHYRWTSQCQCNRKTPTCLTWQVSADFCVFQFLLF